MNGCAYNEVSKEEIEKAKDDFRFFNEGDYITKEMANSKEKLFEYIEQLEEENVELRIENSAMNTVLEDLKARLL